MDKFTQQEKGAKAMKAYGLTKFLAADDDKAGLRAAGRASFHSRAERRATRRRIKRIARRTNRAACATE